MILVVVSQINISHNFEPPNNLLCLPGTNQPFSLFPYNSFHSRKPPKIPTTNCQVGGFRDAPTLTHTPPHLFHCQYCGNFILHPLPKKLFLEMLPERGLIGCEACGRGGMRMCSSISHGWVTQPLLLRDTRMASHEVCCCCGSGWKIVQISKFRLNFRTQRCHCDGGTSRENLFFSGSTRKNRTKIKIVDIKFKLSKKKIIEFWIDFRKKKISK